VSFQFKGPPKDKDDFQRIPNTEAYEFAKTLVNKFDFALDIGAHIGTMARLIAADFGQVRCFEPAFHVYTEQNTADLGNVIIEPYALGNENKQEEMYIMDRRTGGSSIVKHPLRWRKWQKDAGKRTIDIRRLDNYGLVNIDFIKIDVESYEYFVIDGARETLKSNSPVIMIEYLDKFQHAEYPPAETNRLLEKLGYKKVKRFVDDYIYIKD
jgi:FkbM family methyltransferase